MFVCVGIVGKLNNPLFIQQFNEEEGLKFHYLVHTSLDIFEEKVLASSKTYTGLYFHLLFATEDYRIYGYITNTAVKFILILRDYDLKEMEGTAFFRKFHNLYVDLVSNPFYTIDDSIESEPFQKKILELCRSYEAEWSRTR